MGEVGVAVGSSSGYEPGGDPRVRVVVAADDDVVGCDGGDGGGRAVGQPAVGGAQRGVEEDPVAGAVIAVTVPPAGSGHGGCGQLLAVASDRTDPVGEVFAVRVADGKDRELAGAVPVSVCDGCVRERVAGLFRGGVLVFPAVGGADGLTAGDITGAVAGERGTFGRVAADAC